jgi:hypothetical protein
MFRRLTALAVSTAIVAIAAPAAPSIAADATTCTATALELPAGASPNGGGLARTADPSGRYIVGHAVREGTGSQAVLWADGVPRWLASQPDSQSQAYSVAEGAFVLGTSVTDARTDYWIYSATTDSYRILQPPKGLQISYLSAMNNRQDILGVAWNKKLGHNVPFVWPEGRQPRLLPTPIGRELRSVDDISDEGQVIALFARPEESVATSYLWKSWNARPTRLQGLHQETMFARDLEGPWVAGDEVDDNFHTTGLIRNTHTGQVTEIEDGVIDLNRSGDAVTYGGYGLDNYPSTLVRSDGTKVTFPEGARLFHVFERNSPWTAAGSDNSSPDWGPVVYRCAN